MSCSNEGEDGGRSRKRKAYLDRLRNKPPAGVQDPAAPSKFERSKYNYLYKDSKMQQIVPAQQHDNKNLFSEEWEIYLYRIAYKGMQRKNEVKEVDMDVLKRNIEEQPPWISKLQPYVEFVEHKDRITKKPRVHKLEKEFDAFIIGLENLEEEDQKRIQAAEKLLEKEEEEEEEEEEEGERKKAQESENEFDTFLIRIRRDSVNRSLFVNAKQKRYMKGVLLLDKFLQGESVPCLWLRNMDNERGFFVSIEFSKVIFSTRKIEVLFEDDWIKFQSFLEQVGYGVYGSSPLQTFGYALDTLVSQARQKSNQEYKKGFSKKLATREEIQMLQESEKGNFATQSSKRKRVNNTEDNAEQKYQTDLQQQHQQ